jgi:hypothetical protein
MYGYVYGAAKLGIWHQDDPSFHFYQAMPRVMPPGAHGARARGGGCRCRVARASGCVTPQPHPQALLLLGLLTPRRARCHRRCVTCAPALLWRPAGPPPPPPPPPRPLPPPAAVPRSLHFNEYHAGRWGFDKHNHRHFDVHGCPPWPLHADRPTAGIFPPPPHPDSLATNSTVCVGVWFCGCVAAAHTRACPHAHAHARALCVCVCVCVCVCARARVRAVAWRAVVRCLRVPLPSRAHHSSAACCCCRCCTGHHHHHHHPPTTRRPRRRASWRSTPTC